MAPNPTEAEEKVAVGGETTVTILDRLVGHDAWTSRQLLLRSRELTDEQLDRTFDIGDRSLRDTFHHLIGVMEFHTDLLLERGPETEADHAGKMPALRSTTLDGMLARLTVVAKEFAEIAARVEREGRADEMVSRPGMKASRSIGGLIAHILTHSMHHRAQILYILEQLGVENVIEGDALGWESVARGWGWEDGGSYGNPSAG